MNGLKELAIEAGGRIAELPNGDVWLFDTDAQLKCFAQLVAAAEREACAKDVWPELKVWSEEELNAMGKAFNIAQEKHGWYETLMAVGAAVLKIKADAIRARS